MRPLRIAAVQHAAGPEVEPNLRRLEALLPAPGAADVVALPEVFAVRGDPGDYRRVAAGEAGAVEAWLSRQARERRVWLVGGSVIEPGEGGLFNTCPLYAPDGTCAARYRKIHLFEATLDDGRTIREADVYRPGDRPVTASLAGWTCGLAICYDLRFPELFRAYSAAGAQILFLPSNFTQRTGRDHWEVLVRARAIENQCFVVAPGQCGANARSGVASYGHSLVVGPWGEALAEAGDDETVLSVTLDPERLRATRSRVPALRHRRL
jgi:nitrilase